MKINWIPSNDFYHQIIAAPDHAARERLYTEKFIEPFKPMMKLMAPMFNADPADEYAVARAWAWLLPEDLSETPAILQAMEAANAWEVGAMAMKQAARCFTPYDDQLAIDSIEGWLVLADPTRSDPGGRGYTGAVDWTQDRIIVQYNDANDYSLPRLPGAIVHEMHHVIRLKLFPWDMQHTSVADYIIHEGMAESFAAALFGEEIVGYYVTDCDEAELTIAGDLIADSLDKTGFDLIRSYIFGDTVAAKFNLPEIGMPAYGGYAIGYRVVQAFLRRTSMSITEATLLPAEQIVGESGFF